MKSSIKNASARQHSGGPSTIPYRGGDRNNRRRSADIADVEREIAELVDRSTLDLRVGWRQLHRTEPPPGLSRDLIIRALAHHLQEGSYGEASRALRRRLQSLSAEFEKGAPCRDLRIGLKAGTTLVRQWRGHTYTVLVREDGFEYEGQHYRSLTVIAERITGAHWSGPRFFGLAKHAQVLWSAPRPADDDVSRHSTRRNARVR